MLVYSYGSPTVAALLVYYSTANRQRERAAARPQTDAAASDDGTPNAHRRRSPVLHKI